jgi:aspartyl-tRNA synthetase
MGEGTGSAWRRTHTCGELRARHVGQEVTLNGWVHARRDHGGIYFIDLRDRYGITQVLVPAEVAGAVRLGPEFVLSVRGHVLARGAGQQNRERPTGEIEVQAQVLEVLAGSPTPPIEVAGGSEPAIETRLRYRFIDLRREGMRENLLFRARFISAMRRAFEAQSFVEVETPILTKATPEGARDYLVPSRVHPGLCYALPQSPQIFKQILMVAGFDRYFQVAKCFRDEDLRADRQPEFTQLDMEMSFVEEEDVFEVWERVLAATFREVQGLELATPFPRLSYDEAMERFGVDKPDTRFGLELRGVDEWAGASDFQVFRAARAAGGRVIGLAVPAAQSLSRKQLADLEQHAKSFGAKGLAWWKAAAEGGSGPLARFATSGLGARDLMARLGAQEGDTCLFVADAEKVAWRAMGELRNRLGRELGLIPEGRHDFLWVTRFPMFERDAESGGWTSLHHPFTAPVDWSLGGPGADLGRLASRAYDLVLDGWELGSGSIRIHRSDVQERVFEILGIGPEERRTKFGFLLEALAYGAPPHGGFALGLDRTVALAIGLDNIRDVIAFPKTATAADLMCGAPSAVGERQLAEVHVKTLVPPASP